MSSVARQKLQQAEPVQSSRRSNGNRGAARLSKDVTCLVAGRPLNVCKARVFIAAENRLLREALSRMLSKLEDMDVVGTEAAEPFRSEDLLKEQAEILLLTSRGTMNEDLLAIRNVRVTAPNVQIMLIGVTGAEMEFLQCVRAGVNGYLPRDASAEDVVEGVRALRAGEAVCPGTFCAALFHYLEREATSFPSASVHQRMGLTRREQQLIPLIAEGLTNKEIANHFCLSEQTVKNHLYRMKHKVGAGDRLGIVQVCRTQGFMV
ncbi:MAG TPA: response regulator transcription factor [Candidatus Acidoferrum sp.]|nr:response regulator transcription factor [Candidatus Acidoferrum sp.]